MSLLVFAAVATAAAAAAYATRNRRRAGTVVGFAGLLLTLWAALAIEAGDRYETAGGVLEATAYGRLFVLLGLVAATLVLVIARLTSWQRNAPAAVLGGAVSLALALATPEPAIGLLACGGAALVATLVALVAPLTPSRIRVLAREVRGAAVGLVLGLAAVSVVPGVERAAPVSRVAAGIALLLAVAAVAQRLAAVPFHARASRLGETAPALGLPLLLAWIPAAWAVVLLEWATHAISPVADAVDIERLLVAALAAATILLGATAALAQDEVEKAVAYALVAAGGLVILAFAALDPAARDGMRAWLPTFIAASAGLAGWTIAIRGAFGTGRIEELAGWIRRAPALTAALVGIGVALLGWPGAATWEARAAVVAGVIGGPAPVLAVVTAIVPLLALGRLVYVGAARPGAAVIAAPGERPRWGASVLGPRPASTRRQASPGPTESEAHGDAQSTAGRPATMASPAEGVVAEVPTGSIARRDDAMGPALAGPGEGALAVAGEDALAGGAGTDPGDAPPAGRTAETGSAASAEGPRGEPTQERGGAAAGESIPQAAGGAAAGGAAAGEIATEAAGETDADRPLADAAAARGQAGLGSAAHRVGGRRIALPGRPPATRANPLRRRGGADSVTAAGYLLDANRVPIRAAVVLLLALAALLAAAGAFDLRGAAAEPAPQAASAQAVAPPRS